MSILQPTDYAYGSLQFVVYPYNLCLFIRKSTFNILQPYLHKAVAKAVTAGGYTNAVAVYLVLL